MKLAVIDPSLFTIPYDAALCDALVDAGAELRLYGRGFRDGESMPGRTRVIPHFYAASERLRSALPLKAVRLLKGVEHTADMLRLKRLLAADRPDVIHFQWAPLPAVDKRLMASFSAIAPTVLTVHDTTPFNGSPNSSLQQMGALAVFGAFDQLIVHTEAGRRALEQRGVDPARIAVIPHGVLALGTAEPKRAGGEKTILLFGKIKHYKGTDLLIEAFAKLPEAMRRTTRLRIVGEPYIDIEPLKARAAELGIADRIDWDPRYVGDAEIGSILAAADVLAFPYREIDASGVLMGSFRYGKPIVATQIGAFRELLRDGEHGRLVPPEDPPVLARALADVLGDDASAAAMGENVKALAAGVPAWDEIARRTLDLYRRLACRAEQKNVLLGGTVKKAA
jgi:glycosyltransferase involved in cell wall biosynthesis